MEKKKNLIIIGAILIVAIVMFVLGFVLLKGKNNGDFGNNIDEEIGYKTNTNEDVIKDQELGDFKFTNTSLGFIDGNSVLRVSVTNTSDETINLREFKIHVYDNEGNEIEPLTGFIGDKIGAGETKFIESSCAEDLTSASRIEYEVID